jgi:aryl-alcohol dehydrogenase-like predicted oxidoreductase
MIAHRPLGASGLTVPAVGFGVSGPLGLGITSSALIKRLVDQCLEAGAGLFDTAPFYGEAEARLGAALAERPRDRFTLITKVGTERAGGGLRKNFTTAAVTESVERSLRTLRTDYLDVVLLHGPPVSGPPPEAMEALQRAVSAGKVRAIGVCGRGQELAAALTHPDIAVVQAPLWIGGWAQQAAEAGRGFLAIEVLRGGVDGFRAPRTAVDLWYLLRLYRHGGFKAVSKLSPGRAQAARTLLRKAIQRAGVASALVTTTRPAHLAANLSVAAAALDGAPASS